MTRLFISFEQLAVQLTWLASRATLQLLRKLPTTANRPEARSRCKRQERKKQITDALTKEV